jgi:hypothetical protein
MEFSEFDINTEFVLLVVNFHLFLRNSGIYIVHAWVVAVNDIIGEPGNELPEPDGISQLQHYQRSPTAGRPSCDSTRSSKLSNRCCKLIGNFSMKHVLEILSEKRDTQRAQFFRPTAPSPMLSDSLTVESDGKLLQMSTSTYSITEDNLPKAG